MPAMPCRPEWVAAGTKVGRSGGRALRIGIDNKQPGEPERGFVSVPLSPFWLGIRVRG